MNITLGQATSGHIQMRFGDKTSNLTQRQISQLNICLPKAVGGFDYYRYVRAYVQEHSDGMVEPWKGQPLFADVQANLDICYYPSLDPDVMRITVFITQSQHAVVVISRKGKADTGLNQIINQVATYMLPGITCPNQVSWFYQDQQGVFRLDTSWYGDDGCRVCYSFQAVRSNLETLRRFIQG